jgi:DNA invertase Pin-like site-specific DNA recombinase
MSGKVIAYYRASTARQGRTGHGIDAQRAAVERYLSGGRWSLLGEFVEVESGKKAHNRPKLQEAMHLAKVTGATLVIAKFDRLSRNAAFLMALKDTGVNFVAADMPDANTMTIGVMAVIAQHEREMISLRTKEALAAAKRRGVQLGNPNGAEALRRARKGNRAALRVIQARADMHAENLRPVVEGLMAAGATTLAAIAAELNQQGMLTPRGGQWHKSSVRNLLARLRATAG